MKINCLGCGYQVELADSYDDYEGAIKCFACGAIIEIVAHEGNIREVRLVAEVPLPLAEKAFKRSPVVRRS
jgi:DNA-directed RNA polymerase subunit N (RpoN/RPB10)